MLLVLGRATDDTVITPVNARDYIVITLVDARDYTVIITSVCRFSREATAIARPTHLNPRRAIYA